MKISVEFFEWFDTDKCMTKLKECQIGWEERKAVTSPPVQGYSEVPPRFPNSTAQQPRQTRQKGAYQ